MAATPPFEDSHWPRASAWLSAPAPEHPVSRLAVLGAPLNRSITPGAANEAPAAIRRALERFSVYDIDHHIDLRTVFAEDLGDLDIANASPEEALEPIKEGVSKGLDGRDAVVLLGGDNGITRAGVHGLALPLDRCGLLTFDAHFDLRSTRKGLHNGNPIRALLEDGMPGPNIVQIGLQSFANSPDYADVAIKSNIAFHSVEQAHDLGLLKLLNQELVRLGHLVDVIYVDLDLDVMDRAFTPGTPGARPGGFNPHEMRRAAYICGLNSKVKVLDLVEIDPQKDTNDLSCLAAASFLLSFAAGTATRHPHPQG